MDFVEICNVYIGKMIIKAAKRIFNYDKICRSYSDLNFGVTIFGTQCKIKSYIFATQKAECNITIERMCRQDTKAVYKTALTGARKIQIKTTN